VLAKPRDLMPGLRDKWGAVMREAGGAVVQAGRERQPGDQQQNRFECAVEDFHSSLDQVELNLKCAAETTSQATASSRYMLANLSYHQYLATAKQQVAFTSHIRDLLRGSSLQEGEQPPGQQ